MCREVLHFFFLLRIIINRQALEHDEAASAQERGVHSYILYMRPLYWSYKSGGER